MARRWRITGISAPWGGVQWEYLDGDAEIARRVVSILEDRRMLWVDFLHESHRDVMTSASMTREALTAQINTIGIGPDLAALLKELRKLFAAFMTANPYDDDRRGDFGRWRGEPEWFLTALGALRAAVGERLAVLVSKYDLDVDDDLRSIVPDSGAWFFRALDDGVGTATT